MKRRSFVKSTLTAATAAAIIPATSHAAAKSTGEFYELRVYILKDSRQQALVEDFLKNAAIPALNRMGVKHIGVFTELKPVGDFTKLFVIIPYNSIEHFNTVVDALPNDADYKTNGAAYLTAPAKQAAYERIESSLLKAFPHAPVIEVPEKTTRIFELRQYQSATETGSKRKIDMFDRQGEIPIFKRLGFKPVFFAETIIGIQRPNLTYMITFDNLTEKDAHWKAFGDDPEWKRLKSLPENPDAELVSKVISTVLVPADYSQV